MTLIVSVATNNIESKIHDITYLIDPVTNLQVGYLLTRVYPIKRNDDNIDDFSPSPQVNSSDNENFIYRDSLIPENEG